MSKKLPITEKLVYTYFFGIFGSTILGFYKGTREGLKKFDYTPNFFEKNLKLSISMAQGTAAGFTFGAVLLPFVLPAYLMVLPVTLYVHYDGKKMESE